MTENTKYTAARDFDIPQLSDDAAGKLLANVFDACELEPCNIPIETLSSYSQYRRERYSVQKFLIFFMLALFVFVPLAFVAPNISISEPSFVNGRPVYNITVNSSIVPVARVSAAIDGKAVGVYESGVRTYSVSPSENGTLEVRVTLKNRQYNIAEQPIDTVDITPPSFRYSAKTDELLYIFVTDTGTGLDGRNASAITFSGAVLEPAEYSDEKQYVAFAFPDETVNLFIPDKNGNVLQLVISLNQ